MREMRKIDRKIGALAEIEEVLRAARVMRLALSEDGRPYLVPLNFGYEPGVIWFHSAVEGRKLDIIARNPRVAFEVETEVEPIEGETPCAWSMRFASVIGFGTARLAASDEEKLHGLQILMTHQGGPTEGFDPAALAKTAVVRIDIEEMTGKRKA